MKKIFKKVGKCLIIYVVIFMLVLSGISYGYSSAEVRGAIGGFAEHFVNDGNEKNILRYTLDTNLLDKRWGSDEPNSDGLYYFCCATFVSWVYEQVGGYNIRSHSVTYMKPWIDENCIEVPVSDAQPGDILWVTAEERGTKHGHTAIVVSDGQIAHASSAKAETTKQVKVSNPGSYWRHCFRLTDEAAAKVEILDTTFSIAGTRGNTNSINYSKFFFNGIPDGQYSLPTRTIWETIIDTLAQVLDFLINLILYIIRMVFVGWTALMENLLNWGVNVVSNTNAESKELDISSTEASTVSSSKYEQKVTIDSIIFNKLELFDINVFNFE